MEVGRGADLGGSAMDGTAAAGGVATPDQTRLTARVEEQYDADGELVWTVMLAAKTYSRREIDWLAEALGAEIEWAS